jgi:hypothetical protein
MAEVRWALGAGRWALGAGRWALGAVLIISHFSPFFSVFASFSVIFIF